MCAPCTSVHGHWDKDMDQAMAVPEGVHGSRHSAEAMHVANLYSDCRMPVLESTLAGCLFSGSDTPAMPSPVLLQAESPTGKCPLLSNFAPSCCWLTLPREDPLVLPGTLCPRRSLRSHVLESGTSWRGSHVHQPDRNREAVGRTDGTSCLLPTTATPPPGGESW